MFGRLMMGNGLNRRIFIEVNTVCRDLGSAGLLNRVEVIAGFPHLDL